MNANTLRFGIARAAVLSVVFAAAALYAGNAHADEPVAAAPAAIQAAPDPQDPAPARSPAEPAAPSDATASDEALPVTARPELLAKVAASPLIAPRGFVLAMPAALAQPTL